MTHYSENEKGCYSSRGWLMASTCEQCLKPCKDGDSPNFNVHGQPFCSTGCDIDYGVSHHA